MEGEEVEEDDEAPIEVFGIHRLELKPGSKSGYVGVRPNASKKCHGRRGCRMVGSGRR